jgi:hypothetical protein
MTERRRFPRPWSVEETDACFIARDANGHALVEEESDKMVACRC